MQGKLKHSEQIVILIKTSHQELIYGQTKSKIKVINANHINKIYQNFSIFLHYQCTEKNKKGNQTGLHQLKQWGKIIKKKYKRLSNNK